MPRISRFSAQSPRATDIDLGDAQSADARLISQPCNLDAQGGDGLLSSVAGIALRCPITVFVRETARPAGTDLAGLPWQIVVVVRIRASRGIPGRHDH